MTEPETQNPAEPMRPALSAVDVLRHRFPRRPVLAPDPQNPKVALIGAVMAGQTCFVAVNEEDPNDQTSWQVYPHVFDPLGKVMQPMGAAGFKTPDEIVAFVTEYDRKSLWIIRRERLRRFWNRSLPLSLAIAIAAIVGAMLGPLLSEAFDR